MKKKAVLTIIILSFFFAGFAAIGNLSGRWGGFLKTDQGDEYPLLYNFKIDDGVLTGTAKTPKGYLPINDGKITGNKFTFNVVMSGMKIDHSGKFYGDSVGVDISMGDERSHATLIRPSGN